jgi:arginine repressor
MKGGVIELRQKGASLGLIRELLATVGVTVSTATIARFLTEVATIQLQHDNVNDSLADALPFRTRSECNVPPFRQRPSR